MTRDKFKLYTWELKHRINQQNIIERQCSVCKEWKIENEENFYYINKNKKELGFSARCRECGRKYSRKKITDDPTYNRESAAKFYKANREQEIERLRQWRIDNAQRKYEYQKKYYEEHPHQIRAYNYNKLHNALHDITIQEWENCKKYFNHRCAYCGLPIEKHLVTYRNTLRFTDFHKEHVIHKGSNYLDNCVPSCKNCNSQKWEFALEEWFNVNNSIFSQERLEKIHQWLSEDYKKYIKN